MRTYSCLYHDHESVWELARTWKSAFVYSSAFQRQGCRVGFRGWLCAWPEAPATCRADGDSPGGATMRTTTWGRGGMEKLQRLQGFGAMLLRLRGSESLNCSSNLVHQVT